METEVEKESVKGSEKAGKPEQYKVDNNTIRDNFVKQVQKEISGIEVVLKKTGRKEPNDVEPLLKFGKRNVMICAPSSQGWWSAYKFGPDGRQIVRVTDEKIQNEVFNWVKSRVVELEQLQKQESKKQDKPKKSKKSTNKTRTVEELKESILERMKNCVNSGISFPKEVKGSEEWFKELVSKHGWAIDTERKVILKGSQ